MCVCKYMRVSIEDIEGAARANRDFWLLCSDVAITSLNIWHEREQKFYKRVIR